MRYESLSGRERRNKEIYTKSDSSRQQWIGLGYRTRKRHWTRACGGSVQVETPLVACLEREAFLTFLCTLEAMAKLLRQCHKEEQVAALMRNELTELHIGGWTITADGAKVVAEFLEINDTVLQVNVNSCYIRLRGAKAIAEALKQNRTVEELNIVYNQIGNEGGAMLIEALHFNVCITTLECFSNGFEAIATISYLIKTRNRILIPAVVRGAALCLITARRNIADAGDFAIFPKEIVKLIAMEVWATRKDPIWIQSLSESERTGEGAD